jgi:hypothetical protein
MSLAEWTQLVSALSFGKRLPKAVYFVRLDDWSVVPSGLAATVNDKQVDLPNGSNHRKKDG